ncbi:MAG: cold shock domain-containing protein [Ignavibacteria bacterium]|nr:cold shock domain-containing protein [Ignavibacteria bacterium]
MEPLDFCRVKKIDEKGYGFLKSLHYPSDIFFHFSQIKKEEFREKLNAMKRGEFFLFFISKQQKDGRRKAAELYYSIDSVPIEYLQPFAERILTEFDSGRTNIFDLIFVFNELRRINFLTEEMLIKILSSKRITVLPTTILPHLTADEIPLFKSILHFDELKTKPFWYDDFKN